MAGFGGGYGFAAVLDGPAVSGPRPSGNRLEFQTFEDFGAVGDFDMSSGRGTDDTAAIQRAIDWAYGEGKSAARAILMSPKLFLCGPITTYPTTTIVGTGRQTSAFCCRDGTVGAWWSDRGKGAQKLMLSGITWYGRHQPGLTHICVFGKDGVQFGTEGILQGLWTRDAPNAVGLWINGNVGIVRDLTTQRCATGIEVLGNANHLENIFVMECSQGARLHGCFVRGLHIEATDSGGLPLWLYGDSHVTDLLQSNAKETEFDELIVVDTGTYDEWSLSNVQFLGRNYRVKRGLIRIGDRFVGGTEPRALSGATFLPALHLPRNKLTMGGQRWHSFAVELRMGPSGLVHRIGASGDPGLPSGSAPDMRSASSEYQLTGVTESLELEQSTSLKLVGRDQSSVLFNLPMSGDPSTQAVTCAVARNSSGVPVVAWAKVSQSGLLLIELSQQGTGDPFSPRDMRVGSTLVITVAGWAG
ncbi:hypothetical protein [Altererythrobacter sp. Root672]|uniref:hypothetical protein n=1 Tax=Altererythrobacter sp. Root672 TaxID=1736584 RepID=UPI0006F326E0|nr:hypothetical protein [Altererythrobacter sp. Root672]KRA83186.1 hypothetical protein ASD76_03710 [Altererythrobacter sp. Root672]